MLACHATTDPVTGCGHRHAWPGPSSIVQQNSRPTSCPTGGIPLVTAAHALPVL